MIKKDNFLFAMDKDLNTQAQAILEAALYMVVSTSTCNGDPWIAPVAFWMDDAHNFFFVSHFASRHVQDITRNPRVAISIFDTSAPEGKGQGLQFGGYAYVLDNIDEAVRYSGKRIPIASAQEQVDRKKQWLMSGRRVIKVVINKEGVFINRWDGKVDRRVRVSLHPTIHLRSFRSKL